MGRLVDARVEVVCGPVAAWRPGDALLVEGEQPVPPGAPVARLQLPARPPHPAGCACCVPRSPAADALSRLFLARARGEMPFFRRVLVVGSAVAEAAVRQALAQDPVLLARFRDGGRLG